MVAVRVLVDASAAAQAVAGAARHAADTLRADGEPVRGHRARVIAGAAVENVRGRIDADAAASREAWIAGDAAGAVARRVTVLRARAALAAAAAIRRVGAEIDADAVTARGALRAGARAAAAGARLALGTRLVAAAAVGRVGRRVDTFGAADGKPRVAQHLAGAADASSGAVQRGRARRVAGPAMVRILVEPNADLAAQRVPRLAGLFARAVPARRAPVLR
jgi:hypothetical protein